MWCLELDILFLLRAQQYQVNAQNNCFLCLIHKTPLKALQNEICLFSVGISLNRLIFRPTPALSVLHCCRNGYDLLWTSVFGVYALTISELYLGTITSAGQLSSVSRSFQLLISPVPLLSEGMADPKPAAILYILSSVPFSESLREMQTSPGARTSGR